MKTAPAIRKQRVEWMLRIQQAAAKAGLAIGAEGIMAEVHLDPAVVLSDAAQQMNLQQFDDFYEEIIKSVPVKT